MPVSVRVNLARFSFPLPSDVWKTVFVPSGIKWQSVIIEVSESEVGDV